MVVLVSGVNHRRPRRLTEDKIMFKQYANVSTTAYVIEVKILNLSVVELFLFCGTSFLSLPPYYSSLETHQREITLHMHRRDDREDEL
jgi:hypothetical protein